VIECNFIFVYAHFKSWIIASVAKQSVKRGKPRGTRGWRPWSNESGIPCLDGKAGIPSLFADQNEVMVGRSGL